MQLSSRPLCLCLVLLTALALGGRSALADDISTSHRDREVAGVTLRFFIDRGVWIDRLQLLRDGEVHADLPFENYPWVVDDDEMLFPLPPGRDVTGDGVPDLVIQSYSGGAHCCYRTFVFDLGAPPRLVADVESAHAAPLFADLDGRPGLEIEVLDWTFAYWRTGFASSPAAPMVLSLKDGAYAPDPALMRGPAPDAAELAATAAELRADESWRNGAPPPWLWGEMQALIHRGQGETALELLRLSWPSELPGRETFLVEFSAKLGQSHYWTTLAELNGWAW